jgi:hypothetical protein
MCAIGGIELVPREAGNKNGYPRYDSALRSTTSTQISRSIIATCQQLGIEIPAENDDIDVEDVGLQQTWPHYPMNPIHYCNQNHRSAF